jgi:hypothetical protein
MAKVKRRLRTPGPEQATRAKAAESAARTDRFIRRGMTPLQAYAASRQIGKPARGR